LSLAKPPATIGESVKLSEIRSYISALEGSRFNFVTRHANDARVVQAILDGPPFLSGLSEGDIGIIKTQVAKRVAPKITEAKEKTIQALGWRLRGTRKEWERCRNLPDTRRMQPARRIIAVDIGTAWQP
jgi:hypothetical protein